jgi:hypothetical protein
MAHFAGASSTNFGGNNPQSPQANSFWVPEIFSKKVQLAYRKSAVCEAITNTDYTGEISQFGDTVNIIKEPDISVTAYTRGLALSSTALTDHELVLTIDQANYFQFQIDDLEEKFSHVNWQAIASDRAGYKLKDAVDVDILSYIYTTLSADTTYGIASAVSDTHFYGGTGGASNPDPIDVGHDSGEVDPLNVLARLARYLDAANIPEDMRWVVAGPEFYEQLILTNSKLISVDYNGGSGDLRNGLVASGKLRGFQMYKSNNLPEPAEASTTTFTTGKLSLVLAGHMSAVASATALTKVETVRSTTTFADIVRGLHVWGRKVLRPESLAASIMYID